MIKFVKGNEAVVMGALYANCKAFFGYPITPASEIAHCAAKYFTPLGRTFLQAECETASINMLYGAGSAGVPAMTATSGPGFSLMQEGVSYMAGAELPGVVCDVMRAGPGLGNIFPEQGDYNQIVKGGGHGNYKVIVLAPGNVQEMCDITMLAFQLAFKWRTPVIVMADAMLGQMMEPLRLPAPAPELPDVKSWAVQGDAATRPNLITSIFLDAAALGRHNVHLQEKYAQWQSEVRSETYKIEDADTVLCAYGVSARISRTAVDELRAKGLKVGLFRPITLEPFPVEAACKAVAGKRVISVELSNGQFRDDLCLQIGKATGKVPNIELVSRMGGELIAVQDIVDTVVAGPAKA